MNEKIMYEIYRLQLLNGINNIISSGGSWDEHKSMAFALSNRMYPYFEMFDDRVLEMFTSTVYDVSCSDLDKVYKYLDTKDMEYSRLNNNLKPLTYYQIERDTLGKEKRCNIILAIEYAKINDRFGWLYSGLNYNNESPIESHFLTKPIVFNISNIRIQ